MFALHETTQRRVCRVLFIVLCVVPTVLTLVGIAYCNRPWRQEDWQRTLAEKFHIRAELEDISRPQPGHTVLNSLRLADLRTGCPLGSIDQLTILPKTSQLSFQADSLMIQAQELRALAMAFSTWLATGEMEPLEFHADRLRITSPTNAIIELSDFSIFGDLSDPTIVRFRAKAISDSGKTLQVLLESENNSLRFVLDAQQAAIPAWLLGTMVPGIGGCGEARFRGLVAIETVGQETTGKLKGQLGAVDLQKWIGSSGLHRLIGVADIQFDQLQWSGGGLDVVRGSIKTKTGAASYSLLEAVSRLFACVPGPVWESLKPASRQELISFDKLALDFDISQMGITFVGGCDESAIVVSDSKPLLFGPLGNKTFPVAQLVNLFHHPRQGWMPDTREAHSMAKDLPLPRKKPGEPQPERK